jgi:hypothetical protein
VNSFWYSMSTIAVVEGSSDMWQSSCSGTEVALSIAALRPCRLGVARPTRG